MANPEYDRQAIADEVFKRMAEGEWLRAICRDDHMPSIGTFLRWVGESPDFAERYAHARANLLDVVAEQLIQISDTPETGQKTVSKATGLEVTEGDMTEHRRLRIETRKWLLAKLAPKKYGEKLGLTDGDGGPLTVVVRKITDA